ncbi:uncharacterized protein SCDLUD_004093 [Saccharomycodes ludwigii]|uniref:uncharacterized protein n=1 Tax=Saccharomycodes ludwigii TaxID=36035 RepID=UPI001E83C86B|nr:hypothetical protein SCDLUD_004093 [Saccharomycodes ludwigii]KAH3899800.1 hypothetical protein SCDLUD_004093 [Saccharomycodes ludwigii]
MHITPSFFIVCRAFQGFGIKFILPNVMGIVGNIYLPGTQKKNMVISLIGACAHIGATYGMFWLGLIVHYSSTIGPGHFMHILY